MKLETLLERLTVEELIALGRKIIEQLEKSKDQRNSISPFDTKIRDSGVSVRAQNVCMANEVDTLQQLSTYSIKRFLQFRNAGKITLFELTDRLEAEGLSWKS